MRVIRQLFAAVALAVLAAAPSVAQESQGAVLDARIANWSLDNELARRASDIRDCEADPVDRLICALGRAGASPIEREEARWLLTMSLQALDLGADPQMTSEFYLIAGASALALYRLDASEAGTEARRGAFVPAVQIWEHLLGRAVGSADPAVQIVMAQIFAQAYVESTALGDDPVSQTKWLTNLGNSLARAARHIPNPEAALEVLFLAVAVRQEAVVRLEDASDPVRLARALLNRGNGYVQASQIMAQRSGVDAVRPLIDQSGEHYARAIDILLTQTDASDAAANRLLTTVASMRALSMTRGAGDEYRAHRTAIALLQFLREEVPERISPGREVDLALAEIGVRIQLIDRLVGAQLRLAMIAETLDLFNRYEEIAVERRPEPDTALSIGISGLSLYAARGEITGDAADCGRAERYWDALEAEIPLHLNVNRDNVGEALLGLIDCHVATDPALAIAPDPRIARIESKAALLEGYVQQRPYLAHIRPLRAEELALDFMDGAGGEACAAGRAMLAVLPEPMIADAPGLWALRAQLYLCEADHAGLDAFIDHVAEWLIARENNEAQTRSGLAMLARRTRQPITDLAIVFARAGKTDAALWLLDFRDRSRTEPLVRAARARLFEASPEVRTEVSAMIAEWLRHDDPTDLERSFASQGIEGGRPQLVAEHAANSLGLDGVAPYHPTIPEVADLAREVARDRRLAWLLIGTHESGWFVSDANGRFEFVPVALNRPTVERMFAQRFTDPQTPGDEARSFFEARERSHDGTGAVKAGNLRRWHASLDTLSTEVGEQVLAPLFEALAPDAPRATPPRLTLILRNELADLPLHVIPAAAAGAPCGPSLLDCFLVSFAGDFAALLDAPVGAPVAGLNAFWGFSGEPEGSRWSLAHYAQLFTVQPEIAVTSDPRAALDILRGEEAALWLVHGEFDAMSPSRSHLDLSPEYRLGPDDVISRAPDIRNLRLFVLIGCDGALFDTRVEPTEQRGLSEPFLQAGVRMLVVPAWNSETLASLVFTRRLTAALFDGAPPAAAYREATLFLRDASFREMVALLAGGGQLRSKHLTHLLQARASVARETPPFGHITRYGAFKLVEGGGAPFDPAK